MDIRYIGYAQVSIHVADDALSYDVTVQCTDSDGRTTEYRCTVGAPAAGYGPGVAYDSDEAIDRVAHAAASFACDDEPGSDLESALTIGLCDRGVAGWRVDRLPCDGSPYDVGPVRAMRLAIASYARGDISAARTGLRQLEAMIAAGAPEPPCMDSMRAALSE